ncbi:hypothetical protein [Pseudothermotoga thermarum]|uniref:Uncharacterized protein n=1 Tax=Pseudothermotoga thermarum DSM 5069 TaxID=688269 RepID=F7YWT7_9THEM|nr:hypothetical protein [Pseudothermotoga thermarum]AEH50331.1 hypothetical protein Theth_0231 [Pseudothermotoga thermarum DSM 5069]
MKVCVVVGAAVFIVAVAIVVAVSIMEEDIMNDLVVVMKSTMKAVHAKKTWMSNRSESTSIG